MQRDALVEISVEGNVVRIFRSIESFCEAAAQGRIVTTMRRGLAVRLIRQMVRYRAGDLCERCGTALTESTGEMHETVPKGRGGEVSLDNCEWLCHRCHQGDDGAHGDRRWGGRKDGDTSV